MAGHSKWANIKHRKSAADAKRGKVWTKIIREITVAAREGIPDPADNPRLRLAVDKAAVANVPKDTVERAIKRAAGVGETEDWESVRYEGYGPGGVAVMVDCMTNNRNRTAADVRHAFTKCGGNLGTDGSVAYLFTHQGILSYAPGADEDSLMEAALEAGADDVVTNEDGSVDVITQPSVFSQVKDAMIAASLAPANAELTYSAATNTELDAETAEKMLKLVDMLEDLDDVQEVYHNADIAEEILAGLE